MTAQELAPNAAPVTEGHSFSTVSDSLSTCQTEHYYRYLGKDTGLDKKNAPRVELASTAAATGSASLEMCVYVLCDAGATALVACGEGGDTLVVPTTSKNGFGGCCRSGPGVLEPHYSCSTSVSPASSVDTALFYVHVCSKDSLDQSVSYRIEGGF